MRTDPHHTLARLVAPGSGGTRTVPEVTRTHRSVARRLSERSDEPKELYSNLVRRGAQASALMLSRGHGYGHAARDLGILDALGRIHPELQVTLASSGTGTEYFRAHNRPCIDLSIRDDADFDISAGIQIAKFIQSYAGIDLLIADEVLWAIPIRRRWHAQGALFITNWLFRDVGAREGDTFFNQAAGVVILDFPQAHPDLAGITAPVHVLGPIARHFGLSRAQARRYCNATSVPLLLTVATPGVMRAEFVAVVNEFVLDHLASNCRARVLVLGDRDKRLKQGGSEAVVRSASWVGRPTDVEPYFAGADVVIADAKGVNTLSECVRNRIPAVAIVHGDMSASDRLRLAHFETSGAVRAVDTPGHQQQVWAAINSVREASPSLDSLSQFANPIDVAGLIWEYVTRNRSAVAPTPRISGPTACVALCEETERSP